MSRLNNIVLIAGFGFFLLSLVAVVAVPWFEPSSLTNRVVDVSGEEVTIEPYTEQELRGRSVYIREICWQCHSQQVRGRRKRDGSWESVSGDVERYGPPTQPGELYYDQPHLFGTRRIGPDLAREGGKYPDAWHLAHLKDPQATVPGSIMPKFTWLFDEEGKPTQDALDLVAYLQRLGTSIGDWRKAAVPAEAKKREEAPSFEQARKLFLARCASCHGEKGDGNGPAAAALPSKPTNFVQGPFKYGDSEEEIFKSITEGRPPYMPAWAGSISEEKREALAAYVKSLREKP